MRKGQLRLLLGSFAFGLIVWLSVTLREQYQTTVAVPLVIENIPDGWAIKTPLPREMMLRFRGDGWRLALLLLSRELRLKIPLYSIPSGLRFSDSHEPWRPRVITIGDITDRLMLRPGVRLVDVKPDSVFIALDRAAEKRVPVVLDDTLVFHDGYGEVGNPVIRPDSVTLRGATSILRNISSWRTARTIFDDVRGPIDREIPLAPSDTYPLSFSSDAVLVRVNVQPFAEKRFTGLPVIARSVPKDEEVIFVPPRIDIVVRAGIQQLANLTQDDFQVYTDYTTIVADTTGSVEVSVIAPEGVQVVAERPDRLQYIVRKTLYETLH